jgi:hypothetical protein
MRSHGSGVWNITCLTVCRRPARGKSHRTSEGDSLRRWLENADVVEVMRIARFVMGRVTSESITAELPRRAVLNCRAMSVS